MRHEPRYTGWLFRCRTSSISGGFPWRCDRDLMVVFPGADIEFQLDAQHDEALTVTAPGGTTDAAIAEVRDAASRVVALAHRADLH